MSNVISVSSTSLPFIAMAAYSCCKFDKAHETPHSLLHWLESQGGIRFYASNDSY